MRKRGRKTKRPPKELFEKLYNDETITVKEIAKLYNVTEGTIYRWAIEYRDSKVSDKQILIRHNYNRKKVGM